MSTRATHYCGHPERIRRGEPTLCGLSLQPDDHDVRAADRKHTTQATEVTCDDCTTILEYG